MGSGSSGIWPSSLVIEGSDTLTVVESPIKLSMKRPRLWTY